MKKMVTSILFGILFALTLGISSSYAGAIEEEFENTEPGFGLMVVDAVVARPLGLVATLVGGVLYVVSLPFSLAGGNEKAAIDVLVRQPAYNTFSRCLGCRSSQQLDEIEYQEQKQ